ncbi:acyltransferase family protein [Nesterenkonia aerolata]|uniref:Acyltransferase family protein n=1 Tax=Nesterenkonia aerolata TaxID=3074079 RepID=A0ABU2DSK4_9MICC|nr:acyltransferase family protein [Nesterenkonia sp. LY-0111]MDR8019361.1 acyltransferase family protein [Nesterenkonia sp. LY-0111]
MTQGARVRNIGVDLLRILSVVAVVLGHAYPQMPGEEYVQIWRMPLFFFLSGWFFAGSRGFVGELQVRWHTLAVPYLSWLLLLSLVVLAVSPTPAAFDDGVILGALHGGAMTDMPYLAFWFISVMFFAAMLLRVLVALPWWVGVLVAVGGLTLAELPDSQMAYTFLGLGLVPACTAYMLAGWWFRRLHHLVPAPAVLGPAAVVMGIAAVALGVAPMNMKWSGFGTYLLSPAVAVLICCGLVLIFSSAVDTLLRRSSPAVRVVSELVLTGTLVVFLHPLVLWAASGLGVPHPLLSMTFALAVCWPLGAWVNRTWASPYLTGLPRPLPTAG